jgi:hypothetical protein
MCRIFDFKMANGKYDVKNLILEKLYFVAKNQIETKLLYQCKEPIWFLPQTSIINGRNNCNPYWTRKYIE